MSVRLNQSALSGGNVELVPYGGPPGPSDFHGAPANLETEGIPWARYIDVLKRHALLILAVVAAGSVLGLLAARRVHPVYDAQSTVWIASGIAPQSGPIRPQQLLPPTSWVELLRSFAIIDPVVRKLRLNVAYKQPGDSVFFRNFESLPSLRPGAYVLRSDRGGRYVLSTAKGDQIERGVVGDSIGRRVGFAWAPEPRLLPAGRILSFSVSTPRSASVALLATLRTALPDDGQFLTITLSGSDPTRTANTLNAWVEQFVASSGDLKKRHLLEFKKTLRDQLGVAESQLRASEIQLEQFRVSTITLPSGGASFVPTIHQLLQAVGAAAQATPDPSIAGYFRQKSVLGEVRVARMTLEQMIVDAKGGPLNPQAFLVLPDILNNTPQLRAAIEELGSRQAALRTETQFLTDANPRIKQLSETVRVLQYETIPRIVQGVLETLRRQEGDLSGRLEAQSLALRTIPARTIEEIRLVRQVTASENLYGALKARYDEVSLAEAQTTPDLSVLDSAIPPTYPHSNDAPRLLLLAVLASVGVAAGIALLHDRIDRRFRYPEQATHDLGLTIASTVPRLRPNRSGEFEVELMSQVVESFRTLRLAVRYDFPADRPVVLTVSSPSTQDGKSLVSSNLALAFASAGHRTLLIDGDVRCGALHSTFDMQVTPGLVEYLCNGVSADAVVKATSTENLFLLPRGKRINRAPELLVSAQMTALLEMARQKFDAVIIDSPPFIAGVDAYALGAVAGSILIVLRQGVSDRKLAAAKLAVLDRLPIRILGVVINGAPAGGMYRYHGTDYAHGRSASDPVGSLATPRGLVVGA
jgi:succinoglycan biosynthesis transport protein ExoP